MGANMIELIAGFLLVSVFASWCVLREESGRLEKVVTDVM
jgi:hypothetical protein